MTTSLGFFFLVLSIASCVQCYSYSEVLEKSLLFYEAQRSGKLPSSNRIPWRGDSMLDDKDGDVDLTGGYFDAGDHVKFNFPQAWALTTLAFGGLDFKSAYVASGQFDYLLDAYKWGADYFLKCHSGDTELYVQVGDPEADHNSWDMPERWTAPRPAFKITADNPGSDIAGEVSALFSAGSELFLGINDSYSNILLDHAKSLYRFAYDHRGKYSDSVPEAAPFYTSWDYPDELAWAAAWLFRVTSEESYLIDVEALYQEHNLQYDSGFSWDGKVSGIDLLLYETTGKAVYADKLFRFCDYAVDEAPKTPKGLLFLSEWGSLRSASNTLFICLKAAQLGLNPPKYTNFAKSQIDLMLGDWGRSFVVGYGTNPPSREHHRGASCPSPPEECGWAVFDLPDPNPHVLHGALVGGPGANDEYEDVRDDAVRNEVALDYNAGFQGAVAALRFFFGDGDGGEWTEIPTGRPELFNVSYTLDGDEIEFDLTAKTRGYIAFGFTNTTCMDGTDSIFTYIDWANGSLILHDLTIYGTRSREIDIQQDWTVKSLTWHEDGESSTVVFRRKLSTGDPMDIIIEDKLMTLAYAIGEYPAFHFHTFARSGNIPFNLIQRTNNGLEPFWGYTGNRTITMGE